VSAGPYELVQYRPHLGGQKHLVARFRYPS